MKSHYRYNKNHPSQPQNPTTNIIFQLGENFVPSGLQNATDTGTPPFNSSIASFNVWLAGYLPSFSKSQLDAVRALYPLSGTAETFPAYNTTYERAGLIYRDSVLACPALWTSKAASGSGWMGEYTISPARHGSDTIYVNLPPFTSFYLSPPLLFPSLLFPSSLTSTSNLKAHLTTPRSGTK